MLPDTIGFSEVVLAVSSGCAALLHLVTLRRAVRDVRYARREGIGNGSMILFRQNRRTELARLHLKLTIFALACYLVSRPNRPGWDAGDWALLGVSAAIIHLMLNAGADVVDRERIKEKHRNARREGWQGPDRRST